jgi:drug/metabolite transporter (DMT)-like permease
MGQIFLTSAYRFAPASVVAPFDYASMLFAIVFGMVFFNEIPDMRTIGGAALVILAGVIIIWREHQLGLERGRARRGMTPQG